ncbi:TIGR02678 family protein [Bacillus sp. PS06]|uniref:TIGR02678 family protein n=1 Tax=Bacillus sp. PS06 TaxID=2764176 RepID=UPI001783182B|nr:TIGR02678 family protein [Bacillus sp. PS06]MBD8069865.1 TIGR02678 family protein [Bacillus sp. PS06]
MIPKAFDQDTQELIEYLLHSFWVTREKNPEVFFAIIDRKEELRQFFYEKFKYDLLIQAELVKLEKIPITPKSWMGIEEFIKKEDYVLFALVMAYLEKLLNEQFVLSDVTKYITTNFPLNETIEWTLGRGYQNRLSLIRVLKYVEAMGMIETVEFAIDEYKSSENYDVLYNKTPIHRYYLRNNSIDLTKVESIIDIYTLSWEAGQGKSLTQKERLYRELLLLPCLNENNLSDDDIEFMREHQDLLSTEFENYLGCSFELYKSSALLTREEPNTEVDIFPNRRKESVLMMQISSLIREYLEKGVLSCDVNGSLYVTRFQLEQWVEEIRDLHSHEWPVAYISKGSSTLVQEITGNFSDWNMMQFDSVRKEYVFYEVMGRICGYSVDGSPAIKLEVEENRSE